MTELPLLSFPLGRGKVLHGIRGSSSSLGGRVLPIYSSYYEYVGISCYVASLSWLTLTLPSKPLLSCLQKWSYSLLKESDLRSKNMYPGKNKTSVSHSLTHLSLI